MAKAPTAVSVKPAVPPKAADDDLDGLLSALGGSLSLAERLAAKSSGAGLASTIAAPAPPTAPMVTAATRAPVLKATATKKEPAKQAPIAAAAAAAPVADRPQRAKKPVTYAVDDDDGSDGGGDVEVSEVDLGDSDASPIPPRRAAPAPGLKRPKSDEPAGMAVGGAARKPSAAPVPGASPAGKKAKAPPKPKAAKPKAKVVLDEEDYEEDSGHRVAAVARQPRRAASKPVSYRLDDSDDDDGDDDGDSDF